IRPPHRYRRAASAGEVFLGPDPVPVDGVEPGGQPIGVRLSDLQPAAGPLATSGPRGTEPSHLADQPPTAPRWGPRDHLPPAILGFFTLLEHMELTLSLEGKARRRALSKTRRLLHESLPDPAEPDHTEPPLPRDRRLTSELQRDA